MSKFVRFGNVIVNTDQIVCIMDNGGKKRNHVTTFEPCNRRNVWRFIKDSE